MSDDFPTFDRPEKAICGSDPGAAPPGAAIVPAYSTL
jgi:hypothetical protein